MHWICCTLITTILLTTIYCNKNNLKVYASDTFPNDGIKRFLYSANVSEIDVEVLPAKSSLSSVLTFFEGQDFSEADNVLYCKSYMTVLAGSKKNIVELWKETGMSVLVDLSRDDNVDVNCIVGQSNHLIVALRSIIAMKSNFSGTANEFIENLSTKVEFSISLDTTGDVFLNMDLYPGMIGYTSDRKKFHNFETNHNPAILIGSPKSYNKFNQLTNYAPGIFDWAFLSISSLKKSSGHEHLASSFYHPVTRKELFTSPDNYTLIVTAFLIKEDHPFLDMSLERFFRLQWSGKKRVIAIFNQVPQREHVVEESLGEWRKRTYDLKYFNSSSNETQSQAEMHNTVKKLCRDVNCSWVWHQNSDVMNIQYDTLEELVSWNLSIIAPFILSNLNQEFPSANFWGDTVDNGFYARSDDYFEIIQRKIGGLFVVPYISAAYLIRGNVISELEYYDPIYKDEDSDVVFCNSVRKSGHLMFLKAKRVDGVFINGRSNASVPHPFFEFFPENHTPFYLSFYMQWDHFRTRDIGYKEIKPENKPCDDVFISSIFTERFVTNMKNKATTSQEWHHRVWTEGWQNIDTMAFSEIGLKAAWVDFSKDYLPTLVDRKFTGFYSDAVPGFTFFMRMTNETHETELLEGKGVYTVLIPLTNNTAEYNGKGIMFNEGVEGCTFNPKIGDLIIFPSRLTHRWKPLVPENGTMIYLVSFYN